MPLLRPRRGLLRPGRGRWLHLPAHGGGPGLPAAMRRLLSGRPGVWDLPELPAIGGPLLENGAVAASQHAAAAAYGVDRCWYGVNGATGMLQAAVLAMAQPGQALLMPRNSHRSLIQACALGGITPVLFDLPFLVDRGHVAAVDAVWLERVLAVVEAEGHQVSGAVLVQPTYHGYAVDPGPLVALLHQRQLPVLVDEAHGAHFLPGIDPHLPGSAVHAGADLVVHSLHKSSTGLGQTAVLWHQGGRIPIEALQRSLSWLQTTSPSALLLASCEAALADWQTLDGRRRLKHLLHQARGLHARLRQQQLPLLATTDPLRLIWHTGAAGISGLDADAWLMPRGLVAELPEPGCLTFCLGMTTRPRLAAEMLRQWRALKASQPFEKALPPFTPPPLPLVASPDMACGKAWCAPCQQLPWADAVGAIAAEMVCPYPPGIPLLVPGERLDVSRVNWIEQQRRFWPDQISSRVRIVA
ncbi:lysine decarboxylase [Synechococcus sp. UW105]|uniref:Orn/Lys/Arg family decarboxylase n=1 Tax=Synechococcus sp. UW105 TaxID=337067 RepID=UPI000E0E5E69|nr:lysine decarboxylase [Synechococcus sp. UW105]